jgi:hypothetical protein
MQNAITFVKDHENQIKKEGYQIISLLVQHTWGKIELSGIDLRLYDKDTLFVEGFYLGDKRFYSIGEHDLSVTKKVEQNLSNVKDSVISPINIYIPSIGENNSIIDSWKLYIVPNYTTRTYLYGNSYVFSLEALEDTNIGNIDPISKSSMKQKLNSKSFVILIYSR